MIKRFITVIAVLAIAAITAGGGVALANRGHSRHVHAVHHKAGVHHHAAKGAAVDGAGESQESAGESQESAGEVAGNDGPGGHEDAASAEVDHQFEGQE
jgi:hypothetical protein